MFSQKDLTWDRVKTETNQTETEGHANSCNEYQRISRLFFLRRIISFSSFKIKKKEQSVLALAAHIVKKEN